MLTDIKGYMGALSDIKRDEMNKTLGQGLREVDCFKVRPAFKSFRMVRNRNDQLWK
jgi:hypothetical protein